MTAFGTSINDVYTRDVIDEANIAPFGQENIYLSFINDMNNLVTSGMVGDWDAMPYDWRFAVDDIVRRGSVSVNDNGEEEIRYDAPLSDGIEPLIVTKLRKLIENSQNGKVTIVAHSNGGLVAKELISALQNDLAFDTELLDHIDKLILVAVPQAGTPKAVTTLLHGDGQFIPLGLLSAKDARTLAEYMPGAYGLLPSRAYFENVNDPVISFTENVTWILGLESY